MIITSPGQCTRIADWKNLNTASLRNDAGLRIDVLENGAISAIFHKDILINQSMGVPPEGAPFRLWLRTGRKEARSLINPACTRRFRVIDNRHAAWHGGDECLSWSVLLALDENKTAWSWHIQITNIENRSLPADIILAQDIGLATPSAIRLNENYNAHYVDYVKLDHADWGPVVCARQNLAQPDARHPWMALACPTGAMAYATDGLDVFGLEQRTMGTPRVLLGHDLPSLVRQGESACAALQTHKKTIEPGGVESFVFAMVYVEHHPRATGAEDLAILHAPPRPVMPEGGAPIPRSIYDGPDIVHGADFSDEQWSRMFPVRRNQEIHNGALWSFFSPDGQHIVAKAKEMFVERMHGHVLLGSDEWLPRKDALGATVYAPGIFSAQTYVDNPNFGRIYTVVRDPLQRLRASGQRVWIEREQKWQLLGTPSAFAMSGGQATWWYQLPRHLLQLTCRVDANPSAIQLECRVLEGAPLRWRITHQLSLDANELDSAGFIDCVKEQMIARMKPDPETNDSMRHPDREYILSCLPVDQWDYIGADHRIWLDNESRQAPYVVAESKETDACSLRLTAEPTIPKQTASGPSGLPPPTWSIINGDTTLPALSDIIPWFRHNAWIHLASPHGLEQYGGGAWGVRDVCQGPMEWLLTEQRYVEAREILRIVFSHQYQSSGLWPQWFMLGDYADIQQQHCHGDVMFWPIKALCDYAEAANDPGILDMRAPFADKQGANNAPLIDHVWLVVAAYRTMCVDDSSLVAYGEGDWDDTLQPATRELRHGMVSAWTVQLAYQAFRQLGDLLMRSGRAELSATLSGLCDEIRLDFNRHLMPDGIVAGFAVYRKFEFVPLLHPRDKESGIQYRLLPMTRGILSGMFDRQQTEKHTALIHQHLRYPDGVRLMDRPVPYRGGISRMFQRAETSAYFGREVSLHYVHAHLRYAEAMACIGDADELWWALGAVNPVALSDRVANAAPRQANVYFSSSDGDFANRHEAGEHYEELRSGKRMVKSGWRMYSSGPGLFLHKVRNCLFGIREYYDQIHFDPVIPSGLFPCSIQIRHEGRDVVIHFESSKSRSMTINDQPAPTKLIDSRDRGYCIDRHIYLSLLNREQNEIRIGLIGR